MEFVWYEFRGQLFTFDLREGVVLKWSSSSVLCNLFIINVCLFVCLLACSFACLLACSFVMWSVENDPNLTICLSADYGSSYGHLVMLAL